MVPQRGPVESRLFFGEEAQKKLGNVCGSMIEFHPPLSNICVFALVLTIVEVRLGAPTVEFPKQVPCCCPSPLPKKDPLRGTSPTRARPSLATTDFGQHFFLLWPRPILTNFGHDQLLPRLTLATIKKRENKNRAGTQTKMQKKKVAKPREMEQRVGGRSFGNPKFRASGGNQRAGAYPAWYRKHRHWHQIARRKRAGRRKLLQIRAARDTSRQRRRSRR